MIAKIYEAESKRAKGDGDSTYTSPATLPGSPSTSLPLGTCENADALGLDDSVFLPINAGATDTPSVHNHVARAEGISRGHCGTATPMAISTIVGMRSTASKKLDKRAPRTPPGTRTIRGMRVAWCAARVRQPMSAAQEV